MLPRTRILIVEDEDTLAENLQRYLARRSQDVRVAADADCTRKVLESFTPDIVVLDFGLPGMDGLQTYEIIVRRQAPQAGCVMISGHLTEDLTRTAGDHGIHHVLCKPFSFIELQQMIDHCLGDTDKTRSDTTADIMGSTSKLSQHSGYIDIRIKDRRVAMNQCSIERRISPDRRQFNALRMQI